MRRPRFGRTEALGVVAVSATAAAVGLEWANVWRRGSAPLPPPTAPAEVIVAGAEAAREAVEVAVEGYKAGSSRENALLNLLLSFSTTFALVRIGTYVIRVHGTFGPIRNVRLGHRHIHHFVPGITLSLLAGGAAILSRNTSLDPWFALPFGAGAALTLDEAALLLELEDVYWTEEGVVSVQIALGAMALLGSAAVALRVLRRGEQRVLGEGVISPPS